MKESFEQVVQNEARKLSIVQDIMIRSTDYLRRIIAPAGGQGGVAMSYLRIVTVSHWKTTFGGARSVERNTIGSYRTGSWWCKQAKVLTQSACSASKAYVEI